MPEHARPRHAGGLRTLGEIRGAQADMKTLRNVVHALDCKLELAAAYGLYEYEAGEAGHEACAMAFRDLAEGERQQIQTLLRVLMQDVYLEVS